MVYTKPCTRDNESRFGTTFKALAKPRTFKVSLKPMNLQNFSCFRTWESPWFGKNCGGFPIHCYYLNLVRFQLFCMGNIAYRRWKLKFSIVLWPPITFEGRQILGSTTENQTTERLTSEWLIWTTNIQKIRQFNIIGKICQLMGQGHEIWFG